MGGWDGRSNCWYTTHGVGGWVTRVIGAYPAVTPTLPLQCPPGKHPVCGEVGCRVACQGRGSCVMRNTGGVTYPAGGLIWRWHKQSPDQYCSLGIAKLLCLKLWQQPDRISTWNWVGIGLKLGLSKQRNLVWKELCLSDFQIPSSCCGRFLSCGVVCIRVGSTLCWVTVVVRVPTLTWYVNKLW